MEVLGNHVVLETPTSSARHCGEATRWEEMQQMGSPEGKPGV